MKCYALLLLAFAAIPCRAIGQSAFPCGTQNFDSVTAPDLPPGWGAIGFAVGASVPRSAPNAAVATGNMAVHELTGPLCEFGEWRPLELVFFERRSSTAATYRLEVSGSRDGFQSLDFCVTFDSAPVLSSYVRRSVVLTPMGDLTAIQLRWRVLPDGTNATGVLRIDDICLMVRSGDGLVVERMEILPRAVTTRDSISMIAHLRNEGVSVQAGYSVQFFVMPSEDRPAQQGDPFEEVPGCLLAAGDSCAVRAVHPPLHVGAYDVLAAAVDDQGNARGDTAAAHFRVGAAAGSVIVNEMMIAPQGEEPEWIEILNITADTVSLAGWSVSDHGLSRKALLAETEWTLAPGQYGIVARESSFLSLHPTVLCPFFTAEFSALNNTTPDGPLLYSDQGVTIDSVRYDPSWGGGEGARTLERIDSDWPSTAASTWTLCMDSSGSTPGRQNSAARLPYDLAALSPEAFGVEGPRFRISVTVTNVGKRTVAEHEVLFFDDQDGDQAGDSQELLAALPGTTALEPTGSVRHEFTATFGLPGEHRVLACVRSAADQRASNDLAWVLVRVPHPPGALVINEVMYEPLEGLCEWVELLNASDQTADVRGWMMSDAPTSSGSAHCVALSAGSLHVRPGAYVVVAGDSTIGGPPYHLAGEGEGVHLIVAGAPLGLANEGDAVIVRDASGSTIDSLAYSPAMHHPLVTDVRGRSLERVRPDARTNDHSNWSTATDPRGASPGSRNTIHASVALGAPLLSIQPNPFSPDDDGWEDFCVISIELPFSTGVVRARVFDTRGRMVRTIANAEPIRERTQIIWNGLDDRRSRVPVGPYVILVEASDATSAARVVHRAVAVVARRL